MMTSDSLRPNAFPGMAGPTESGVNTSQARTGEPHLRGAIDATEPPRANQESDAEGNFSYLLSKLTLMYTGGESSTISRCELHELSQSLGFILGLHRMDEPAARAMLGGEDPERLFGRKQAELRQMTNEAVRKVQEVVELMPAINNISLRDTLADLADIQRRYDTYFAAHEVPCIIDYQLSEPIRNDLQGIDYILAWLDQLLVETRWIAQFDVDSCIDVLERACPDYRGLHVNLYDLLVPHEGNIRHAVQ